MKADESAAAATTGRDPGFGAHAAGSSQPTTLGPPVPDHELLRRIGQGSYGEVWIARTVLGELRAVKIVHRNSFDDDRPFQREFEGLQKFAPISRSHPSQLAILHVGRSEAEGYFYYVMELADDADSSNLVAADVRRLTSSGARVSPPAAASDGQSASAESERLLLGDGAAAEDSPAPKSEPPYVGCYEARTLKLELKRRAPLPPAECVTLGLALAEALAHLHAHGLVHRDIKPSNIIFVGGVPKLADIGLVTDVDASRSFVGTEGYLPPEGPGTPQADIYGLGKVLYELCTGKDRKDYPALPPDLRERSASEQRELLELNAVLVKACATDPRQRYLSAEALHADLALLQRGKSVKAKRVAQHRLAFAKKLSIAAAALALMVTGAWLLLNRFNPSTGQRFNGVTEVNSIAVLPFINQNGKNIEREDYYLSNAATDEAMNALTNCAGLRVVPRSAVFAFRCSTNDLRQIGAQLGVRTILAGTMKTSSNQLNIAAQLLNVADGTQLWSAAYDGEARDIGAIQSKVVREVARRLNLPIGAATLHRLETNLVRKLQAHQLASDGWKRVGLLTKSNFTEAVNLFHRALALDPNHAGAYIGLANVYERSSGWHLAPKEAMPVAKNYVLRALALDDASADAHSKLGIIVLRYEFDWARAEKELSRAVEIERNGFTLSGWLAFLWTVGRWEEAEAIAQENRQREPEAEWPADELGGLFCLQRRYDLALEQARWILQRNPNSLGGNLLAFRAYLGRQDFENARFALAKARAMDDAPDLVAAQARLYGRMGRREDAQKTIAELEFLAPRRYVSKLCWAMAYLGLDEKEKVLDFLEQAEAEHSLVGEMIIDPIWDDLRAEPRFAARIRKMGLEQ